MIVRILGWGLMAVCGAMLAGCAGDPDDTLPPPHLGAPAISHWATAVPPAASAAHDAPLPPAVVAKAVPAADGAVPAAWIPHVTVNNWTWIIIHHSDSTFGSAALIDQWHKARGFDELGYHFVIGNGTNSGDGQVEVGPRWIKQKWGAHDNALDNRYNRQGIGICLVGNFDVQHPTAAQRKSLIHLVAYLMKTYHISADHVLGHGETKDTNCPGKYLHVADIRDAAAAEVAEGDTSPQSQAVAASDRK